MTHLTPEELRERERQIRRLRQQVFESDDPARQDAICVEIERLKEECQPNWTDRHRAVQEAALERRSY